ncbi:MAG TPA: creatininase family protein [Candidatus Binatia bacterium]|nr:creatininase family protein [Candidatus Binatia bacterium]
MAVIRAEELTYTKVCRLDGHRTVCFQPMSALEVHGPHLPLGMDFYMARWMAEETGRRFAENHPEWTVVQMPPLPLGTDELPLAGSMDASQRTVHSALVAHGRSLARAGYKYIVVTNGHGGPRHAAAIEAACRTVSRRDGVQMFSPSIVTLHRIVSGERFEQVEEIIGRALTDAERAGLLSGEHAGSWETSFMLAQQPELVERDWQTLGPLQPPSFRPLARLGDRVIGWHQRRGGDPAYLKTLFHGIAGGIGWLLNARYGYGGPVVSYQGDPSVASMEIGHAFREIMARDCLELVESVTGGRMRARDVRSVASDPTIIQPHFWRRVGIAAAVLLAFLIFRR